PTPERARAVPGSGRRKPEVRSADQDLEIRNRRAGYRIGQGVGGGSAAGGGFSTQTAIPLPCAGVGEMLTPTPTLEALRPPNRPTPPPTLTALRSGPSPVPCSSTPFAPRRAASRRRLRITASDLFCAP